MSARFVILHHSLAEGEHWDLMLESDETLLTWQLLIDPLSSSRLPIRAKRIGDHRKAYLTYEGPLSGGRGDVIRVDEGTVEFLTGDADRYVLRLHSRRFRGTFVLSRRMDGWLFDRAERGSGE